MILTLDDVELEGTNFQIGSECPISEVDLTDESGNHVTVAVIAVIPDDTNNSDSLASVHPTPLQEHTQSFHTSGKIFFIISFIWIMMCIIMSLLDESEISMDRIENRNSMNDGLADTDDSTVFNNSNEEVGCVSDSNGFPNTGEDILNSSTVDISNKDL